MNRSLYTKLVLIMLLLIVSLMLVVGAFLTRGITSFYLGEFYGQMRSAFSNTELVGDLRSAADLEDAPARLSDILRAWSPTLGIDSGRRNYFILSFSTGEALSSSEETGGILNKTPNILTAMAGNEGYRSDRGAEYMDVALPVSGQSGTYIIYILDNKTAVESLSSELFRIILISMGVGLAISVLLSLILAKTVVMPIQELTAAAEKVAGGDFSARPENSARDELGTLTRTFNDMADQLETTLDDLRKSEQMRREFVANVSHELRTPITSIRSYAETLEDSAELPAETRREFLGVIVNESDRMTKIVQDLLTLSRFDVGSIDFTFARFSFARSVQEVYNATLLEAERHSHRFTLELKDELPEIIGDRARIEQVLINMISNAVKYTPDGGRIRMMAGVRGERVWCSVKDNGIGIPEEDVPRVFERFYRVDKARSRESGGTGLGLSIANEIAMRHNGSITVASTLGKGTTITLFLPVEGPENG